MKTEPKSVITYAKSEVAGILVRPDSRAVMMKAAEGHPIDVCSGNDYINLYHVFERLQGSNRKLAALRLVRKQFGPNRWRLYVLGPNEETPDVPLARDYDPKRGRYKRYAEALAKMDPVTLPSKSEAVKARRAWQLYVPAEQRRHLRSSVRGARGGKYVVSIERR